MAMKYYEKEFGDLDYKKWVSEKIKSLNIINHNPISEIQSLENYKPSISSYAYNYGTLVLLAVEQKIGEENMWNWIKGLLNSNSLKTDYNFLIDSLSTHTDKKTLDALRRDIFQNKNSELYIKAYLKKRATTKN